MPTRATAPRSRYSSSPTFLWQLIVGDGYFTSDLRGAAVVDRPVRRRRPRVRCGVVSSGVDEFGRAVLVDLHPDVFARRGASVAGRPLRAAACREAFD